MENKLSKMPPKLQEQARLAHKRRLDMVAQLDAFDWRSSGYSDKFAWMRDQFDNKHVADLMEDCQKLFEQEGML